MDTLTASGAGALLRGRDPFDPAFAEELAELLAERRFVVLRETAARLADAVALLARFGRINDDPSRKDGAVVVEDEKDDEVFRSRGALPLHKDGILTGHDVTLVGIYCLDFVDVRGGRTYVSDANRALERVPREHVALLRERGLEGMAVDASGYYRPEFEQVWHRFPAFRALEGHGPTLHLGLPHAPGERESWRVRVPDSDPETSERVLASLRSALLDPEFTYHHDWREGDLLVMDNYAVLHGREAFEGRRRRLANVQVCVD